MNEKLTKTAIEDRLDPKHLRDVIPANPEEMKKEVQAAVDAEPEKPEAETKANLKKNKEYTFNFEWTDPSGRVWTGEFTNKILTIRERQMAGVMRARLGDGMSADALDPVTAELNLILSHLAYSLTDKPSWASNLSDLVHIEILQELYEEVASHEATFFGYSEAT